MFDGNEFILHGARFIRSAVQGLRKRRRDAGLLGRALQARPRREPLLGFRAQRGRRRTCALDQRLRQVLVEERKQQMLGVQLGIARAARQLLGACDGLLALKGESAEIHLSSVIRGVLEGGSPPSNGCPLSSRGVLEGGSPPP